MANYELAPVAFDEAGLRRLAALLGTVFPHSPHFTEDVLRWQYAANPAGRAVGTNAWAGEELAAHYVTIPLEAEVDGTVQRGLLSLNTATHPAHQGKGLFTQLANATYQRAADEGFAFVVGVANANSTHGFTRKLGFQLVGSLRAMIGAGRLPLRASTSAPAFSPQWTPERLAWRLSHPANRYSLLEEGGTQLVLSQRKQLGARYVLTAQRAAFPKVQLSTATAALLKIFIGLDPDMHWGGAPYVNIPMRFRPSPLNFIFKDLTGQGRTLDAKEARFHAIDFDVL